MRPVTTSERELRPDGALFYYFLVGVDGRPNVPAVLTTETQKRRVGEVLLLADGSRARVRSIEVDETAGRGLDGVLAVERLP
jgi:hypothetical protein